MAQNIHVTVKPNAKSAAVTKLTETEYRVTLHAPAQDGKANRALIELLANYFHVPKSAIVIVRGQFERNWSKSANDTRKPVRIAASTI